ncbi:MAG: hypothetical protein V4819_21195 [Verrucomicrobiota bacterium]
MKPLSQAIAGLAIAITFGAGGYFLGKGKSIGSGPLETTRQVGDSVGNSRVLANRSGLQAIDPKELRAKLDAEKNPLARFKLALQHMESWVAKSPKDALDWLAGQPASDRREEVIRLALNQFSEIDAKGAAGWATANLSGDELNNALISIAENWAEQNGREASIWFLALPPTRERDGALEHIFFAWASNEPAAALEFLATNPGPGDLTSTLRRAALAGWAKSDPEGAVAASLASSRTNSDPAQFANTLANWATIDLEGSSQWLLANLPAGTERTVAAQELATIFAQQSPEAGIAWLDKLSAGPERDAAASSLVTAWARSGASDAAKWAASQKSATLSADAVAEIARSFMLKDAAAFQAWRSALPDGTLKTQVNQAGTEEATEDDN